MNKAAFGDTISSYHIEAAIAYEHCVAATFEETNWTQILHYYDMLAQINPDPVVMLNRLMLVNKIHGSEQALNEIGNSPHLKAWDKHYLFHSLMGEIFSKPDPAKARFSFEKAMELTKSEAEKWLLLKKKELLQ
jgi:RNA polymerase sigma-70 factor (ECF subfamily)